jgi:leucyl/phenylalanyl-tRNA---protein transferase
MVLVSRGIQVLAQPAQDAAQRPLLDALDRIFGATIRACAAPGARAPTPGSIRDDRRLRALHRLGFGHSVETYAATSWSAASTACNSVRCSSANRCSAGARCLEGRLARLVEECGARDIRLIDCQVASAHLASLGAREVPRASSARCCANMRGASRAAPGQKRACALKLHYRGALCTMRPVSGTP